LPPLAPWPPSVSFLGVRLGKGRLEIEVTEDKYAVHIGGSKSFVG